jgi:lipopolysaccharide/colanic/teichoic acid biosynthesis glycosyltransferase
MLGKAVGLTQPAIESFIEAELLWPPREQSSPEIPTVKECALSRASMLGPGFSAADVKPLVQRFPDNRSARPREKRIAEVWLVLKRCMDVALSTIVLILIWPLLLLIAIAIKLESTGPVIYPSLRAGEEGRNFACYKFRTMMVGSDKLKENLRALNQRRGPFFKIADDPRVTRFGRFLRKYSLDELPQLWNVLKGDMSLVGPRPHPVEDCARYGSEDFRRLSVKPGVTGLWQVLARANPSFEICMMLDTAYIEKWSLPLDCKILLKTIPALLAGEGQ